MNEKELNLCEILKDCPKGINLYSPIFGVVTLFYVDPNLYNPICVVTKGAAFEYFTKDGRYGDFTDAECCLFPSKDNRDWSMFKQKERFDPKKFQSFDRVLIRYDTEGDYMWYPDFFAYFNKNENTNSLDYYGIVSGGTGFSSLIPFNDDTKHLIGTTDDCPEYYKWWEE